MDSQQITAELSTFLSAHQNPVDAPIMADYMRNQFDFFGLKKPARQKLCKSFWETRTRPTLEELPSLVQALWESPYRELQYHALDLMHQSIKKLSPSWLNLWEQLVVQKSWWDTVDYLAPRLIGAMLLKYPKHTIPYTQKWIESDNFWLQRVAIIFQLKYKDKTNQQILFDYILGRADSKEFFVQKASGWALREYSKTNAEAVIHFTTSYQDLLSPLTYREARKWMKKQDLI